MIDLMHVLLLIAATLTYYVYRWCTNPLQQIPGPPRLPVIGNLHQMFATKQPHILFTKWKQQFGDIFCIQMVNDYVVVLNSVDTIKEALVDKGAIFGGRPCTFRVAYTCYNNTDLSFQNYSPKVQHMRKVAHWALKTYGVGMHRLEEIVQDEISELLDDLAGYHGEPCDPHPEMHSLFCNVMTSMIFGRRFTKTSPEVQQLMLFDKLISSGLHPTDKDGVMLDTFPWLKYLRGKAIQNLQLGVQKRDEFLEEQYQHMKDTLDPEDIRGVFDALLLSDDIHNDEETAADDSLTQHDLKALIFDLVLAGSVTSSAVSTMAILVLLNRPDIQRKIQDELASVIVTDRLPALEDKAGMPYMEAFVFEVLRYMSHVPLALPHVTLEDTSIGKYTIPKGTQVLPNTWCVAHDERYYKDPWTFMPERFMDEEGQVVPADHPARRNLLAFGAGRRICVGENLAKTRVFLLLSAVLQRFDIKPEDDQNIPTSDPRNFHIGLVLLPEPFKCRFIDRKM